MELRNVIANNIVALRTEAGMTQAALAEVLSYSDKAVSKWERADSIPDVFMLKRIADYFGVTVDYLLSEVHTDTMTKKDGLRKLARRNRLLISFLASTLVWMVATVAFVIIGLLDHPAFSGWLVFVYAIPVWATVLLVFNSVWGRGKLNYLIISIIIWSSLLCFHLTFLVLLSHNIWLIYILGIPAQIMIFLWSGISMRKLKFRRPASKRRSNNAS